MGMGCNQELRESGTAKMWDITLLKWQSLDEFFYTM